MIAHRLTAEKLEEMAARDWTDDATVNEHIREELPAPRVVEIAPADVVFDTALDLDLGGVRVRVEHVGESARADSCVMFVESDGVLFLGDCLCDGVTPELEAALRSFDAASLRRRPPCPDDRGTAEPGTSAPRSVAS